MLLRLTRCRPRRRLCCCRRSSKGRLAGCRHRALHRGQAPQGPKQLLLLLWLQQLLLLLVVLGYHVMDCIITGCPARVAALSGGANAVAGNKEPSRRQVWQLKLLAGLWGGRRLQQQRQRRQGELPPRWRCSGCSSGRGSRGCQVLLPLNFIRQPAPVATVASRQHRWRDLRLLGVGGLAEGRRWPQLEGRRWRQRLAPQRGSAGQGGPAL